MVGLSASYTASLLTQLPGRDSFVSSLVTSADLQRSNLEKHGLVIKFFRSFTIKGRNCREERGISFFRHVDTF